MATLGVGEGVQNRRRTGAVRREDGTARIRATVPRRALEEPAGAKKAANGDIVGRIDRIIERSLLAICGKRPADPSSGVRILEVPPSLMTDSSRSPSAPATDFLHARLRRGLAR